MRPPFFVKPCIVMSVQTDCLQNIIGLSRTTCDCFDVPVNTSDSGLYLDEVEGLNLVQINAAADCGNGSVWDMLERARRNAIGQFKTDLSSRLMLAYKPSRSAFKGIIGRSEFKNNVSPISNIAGIQMLCAPVKNGSIILNRIGLLFAATGTIDVDIYNNIDDAPVVSFAGLNATAGKISWNNIDKTVLPMYTTEADYLIYYIIYSYTGNVPKDNQLQCFSCSGKQIVNYHHTDPVFGKAINDARYTWYQWVNATGITGADIDTVKSANAGFKNLAYGLLLDGEVKCNASDIACNDVDYTNSPVALVNAYSVRWKAAELVCEAILRSTQINRYTMMDLDSVRNMRNKCRTEYSNRLDWLVENMDWAGTGCFTCDPKLRKGSLLR